MTVPRSFAAALVIAILPPAASCQQQTNPRLNANGDSIPEGAAARLGTNRFRHEDAHYLALEPDGKSFWTSNGDRKAYFWETASGKSLGIRDLAWEVRPGVLSPDGKVIAKSTGSTVELYDFKGTWHRFVEAMPSMSFVGRMAFSGDSKTLACQGANHYSFLDVASSRLTTVAAKLQDATGDFAVAPDGKRVYVAHVGATSCLDVAGKELWRVQTATACILVSPDGKKLFSLPSNESEPARLWDADTGKPVGPELPPMEPERPFAAAYSPNGRHIAANVRNGVVIIDLTAGKVIHRLPGPAQCFAFTPDGKTLILCTGILEAFDVTSGKPHYANTREFGHSHVIGAVVWSPDGKRMISSGWDRSLFVWDLATFKPACRIPDARSRWPGSIAFDAGGNDIVSAGDLGEICVWDSKTGKAKSRTKVEEFGQPRDFRFAVISRDATLMIDFDAFEVTLGRALVRQVPTGKPLCTLDVDGRWSAQQGFTPDALVAIDHEGRPTNVTSGKASAALQCPKDHLPVHVFYSADGFLAAGGILKGPLPDNIGLTGTGQDSTHYGLWERATGRLVRSWQIENYYEAPASFSPDGRWLVDHIPVIHDLATGKMVKRIPRGAGHYLSFSPDKRWAATFGDDCTITLWDLTSAKPASGPSKEEIERLWNDLADDDAAKGVPAAWRLAEGGDEVLQIFATRTAPVPHLPAKELPGLLADLTNKVFKTRTAAAKRLTDLGEMAEPALRAKLQQKLTLELDRRIRRLLEPLMQEQPPKGETLRAIRAVQVTECIGTPAAVRLLERWAQGADGAALTRAANDALARWRYGKG
jgi:WD40 repeat protein